MINIFKKYRRYFVLFGGFLLNATIGNLYTFGNMAPFIVQYMQNNSMSGRNVNDGNAVWIFGMGIFGMGSSVILGDFLMKMYGPTLIALLAGWLMSATVLMMYFTLKTYLLVVIFTYGFINGIATGIIYMVTINISCSWFPNRKGTAIGISIAGFGFSSFFFSILQSIYTIRVNESHTLRHVPKSYLMLGGIFMCLQLIGALLLANPETNEESRPCKKPSDLLSIHDSIECRADVMPHEVIYQVDFWILWITYTLLTSCFIIISLHKDFGALLGISDLPPYYFLTLATCFGSLFNSIGGVFWGVLIDKFKYKIVMFILSISLAILMVTIFSPVWIFQINEHNIHNITRIYSTNNMIILMHFLWVSLLYFVASGMFSIFPLTCYNQFGQDAFVANYGILFTSYSIGGLMTSIFNHYIWYGTKMTIHMHLREFLSGSGMAIIASIFTLFYKGRSSHIFRRKIEDISIG